ncbi:restriction endonuclease [Psychrobacter sp. AOP22-C1-C5]|uniref:restriction endonuclease n=1 Tax=Psychrobacter sp. AOP22-C1-C5 TaxID=3457716 RepID=UPI0040366AA9
MAVYAKLPDKVKTPKSVGNYSSKCAVAISECKIHHIYFVAEIKVLMIGSDLHNKRYMIESTKLFLIP